MIWAWTATVLIAGLGGVLYGRDIAGSLIADWVNVSSSLREGVTFVGPLLGLIALLYGRSIYGGDSIVVGPASGRSPERIVAGIFAGLYLAAGLGYLAGYSVAFIDAGQRAATGRPDVLVLVGGLASLGLFVVVGLTLATLPWRRLGPIIGMFVLIVLAGAGASGSFLSLLPTWGGTLVSAGYLENPLLGLFRILWFIAVIAVLIVVTGRRIANRDAIGIRQQIRDAAPVLLLLPFLWWGVNRPIDLLLPEQNPPLACTEATGVEVCVHRARISLLDDLSNMVNRYAKVFDGLAPFGVQRVYDYLVVPYPEREDDLLAVQLPYDIDDWQDQVASELGPSILVRRCEIDQTSQDALARTELTSGIGLWWYRQAGFGQPEWVNHFDLGPNPEPAEAADLARASNDNSSWVYWRLEALGLELAKDWVVDHTDQIRTCALTPEDLR